MVAAGRGDIDILTTRAVKHDKLDPWIMAMTKRKNSLLLALCPWAHSKIFVEKLRFLEHRERDTQDRQ
jgi:hypothetical protein